MARILFVDDDPYTLLMLTKAVQVLGHQAIAASSSQEALALATEQIPDLIFTDMRLSDMEGTNLIRQFKDQKSTADIPMFILSASPSEDVVERAHAAGAIAYLDKPIRLHTLSNIIQEYTSG
jgi:CheY-like chemotaxis protein